MKYKFVCFMALLTVLIFPAASESFEKSNWREVGQSGVSEGVAEVNGTGQLIRDFDDFSNRSLEVRIGAVGGDGRLVLKSDYRPVLIFEVGPEEAEVGGESFVATERVNEIVVYFDWEGNRADAVEVNGNYKEIEAEFMNEASSIDRIRIYKQGSQGKILLGGPPDVSSEEEGPEGLISPISGLIDALASVFPGI